MSEQEYIECDVFIAKFGENSYYATTHNGKLYSLHDALNIEEYLGLFNKHGENVFYMPKEDAPYKVRFRVPVEKEKEKRMAVKECFNELRKIPGVIRALEKAEGLQVEADKPEPPRCEECAHKNGSYCSLTAGGCAKLGMQWWEVRDCGFERTLAGNCGADGKCFVKREKSDAS